jgi:hypothetical protein
LVPWQQCFRVPVLLQLQLQELRCLSFRCLLRLSQKQLQCFLQMQPPPRFALVLA